MQPAAQVSKDTLRQRARNFSRQWADASSEKAQAQAFWLRFFEVFGVDIIAVGNFEQVAKRTSTGNRGWVDVLIPGSLGVEHKSRGEDLDAALTQLVDYLPSLKPHERPRLLVVCDFASFRCIDVVDREEFSFALEDFADNIERFWWLAGYDHPEYSFANDEDANLEATARLARIYDELAATGYAEHAVREWLTRLLFCLFADDTGVWDSHLFHSYVAARTAPDGSDLGAKMAFIFQVLNTPEGERSTALDEDLKAFRYINGDLFEEVLPIPFCNEATRDAVLEACRFDWSVLSPAIFGSMFQNVLTPVERRQLGAHYTSEENILKTIGPLFLDDLEAELERASSASDLEAFTTKLAGLTFFDPAAGCGNFLVIAYRELRRLETKALVRLQERRKKSGQLTWNVELYTKCGVQQFYAIEIEEFPARIARTAMHLMDHLANRDLSRELGQQVLRFPIPASPNIVCADALELDWNDVLTAQECDFCFGNPPFAGHKTRSGDQTAQMQRIWGKKYIKLLDFVSTWFLLAQRYDIDGRTRFAFVATNSITQGEQTGPLFTSLLEAGFTLDFAHQSFYWTSEARGRAQVMVVIIGFSRNTPKKKRLFTYTNGRGAPVEVAAKNISPYLVDGPDIVVKKSNTALSPFLPPVSYWNLLSDGGHLTLTPEELPTSDEIAMKYIRRFIATKEMMSGRVRYCIWMPEGPEPGDLQKSRFLRERLDACRDWRLTSKNADTLALANTPYRFFFVAPQPENDWLGFPSPVSENRHYYTPALLPQEVIAGVYFASDPDNFLFALASSSMFLTWIRSVGGALKSDIRFSKSIVYNTFPTPTTLDEDERQSIIAAGQEIRAARGEGVALDILYAPNGMPRSLVKAHEALDRAVDKWMAPGRRLKSNEQRLAVLLARYVQLTEGGDLTLDFD